MFTNTQNDDKIEAAESRAPVVPYPPRVYLDTADLNDLADGAPEHRYSLRDKLQASGGYLIVSAYHLMDWAKADDPTMHRIAEMLNSLTRACIVIGVEDGDVSLQTANFLELFEANRGVRKIVAGIYDAFGSIITSKVNPISRDIPKEWRKRLYDELFVRFMPFMDNLGIDHQQVWRLLSDSPTSWKQDGDVVGYVNARRRFDTKRANRISDGVDEAHLSFLAYVDIMTVDRNVAACIGREFQIKCDARPLKALNNVLVTTTGKLQLVEEMLTAMRQRSDREP